MTLQGNKYRLPIGKHDSVAWLSCLLLEGGDSVITVTRALRRIRRSAGNYTWTLSVDISGSVATLREVQGSKGDLFPCSDTTLVRGNQTPNHLLHLRVE